MTVLKAKLIELLNYRIAQEEGSSRIYLAMSQWLMIKGYSGAASLWKKYSDEEAKHADWAYNYMQDLNVLPAVPELPKPKTEYKGLPEIIKDSLVHEVDITMQCQELAKAAMENDDFMTLELAQRYLKEQVEELAKTQYWVDRLELFGSSEVALRMLDEEMGK